MVLTLVARIGLCALLVAIAVVDWRRRLVPLRLSLPLLAAGYAAAALRGDWGALLAGGATLLVSERRVQAHLPVPIRIGLGLTAGVVGLWLSLGPPATVLTTLAWTGAWLLWEANIIGGGDAVVFIGLVGLFPDVRFIGLTLGVVVIAGVWLLVRQLGLAGARDALTLALLRVRAGSPPTRAERDERGQPAAFMLALAGLAYQWVVMSG